ncbi:MAG: ATP-binding protein [Bacteroidota bacterium]
MVDGRFHPVTLRFTSPQLEADFLSDHVERSVLLVRASILLAISQFAVFGILDPALAPESASQIRLIRVVMCVVSLGIFAFTFTPAFRRHFQATMAATGLFGGLAIVAMIPVSGAVAGYYDYYIGLVLVLVYVHILLRLRFVLATAVGLVIVIAYVGAAVTVDTPLPILFNSLLFETSALLAGAFASYSLERYARRSFVQSRRQEATTAALSDALADLQATQARLVQEEKMAGLGRIASGLAHELKNPLNFILNFSDLNASLAEDARDALDASSTEAHDASAALIDIEENAVRIRAHAHRADAIVRGLAEHAQRGRGTEGRRLLDVNLFVERHVHEALEAARLRLPTLACDVGLALSPEAGALLADSEDLARVLRTLLHNAFDAVHDHGGRAHRVTVRTGRDSEDQVCIEVADTGPGIPAEDRARVFEPFFTTKPTGSGTGLGLSLAYEVVVSGYDGQIDLEDATGGGALFRVRLPASDLLPEDPQVISSPSGTD